MNEAMRIAREGIEKGNEHFLLLSIYGQAVLAAGVPPGQPAFADAQEALERAVNSHPNFASTRVALGKLYVQAGRIDDAVTQLEAARVLDAGNPAVYSNLAAAYRRRGENQKAEQALATLAKLNQAQAEKIGSAPGERKAGYTSGTPRTNPPH
jgi:predicted Zn-dependent protease